MTDAIHIADAYENNLKHVSLTIPKRKLVVFAGVSGSGKSSLAFDTIAVESSRQWQANYPLFLRNKMPHYERPKVESIENLTPSIVVFTGTPRNLLACPASKTARWIAHFTMVAEASSNSR